MFRARRSWAVFSLVWFPPCSGQGGVSRGGSVGRVWGRRGIGDAPEGAGERCSFVDRQAPFVPPRANRSLGRTDPAVYSDAQCFLPVEVRALFCTVRRTVRPRRAVPRHAVPESVPRQRMLGRRGRLFPLSRPMDDANAAVRVRQWSSRPQAPESRRVPGRGTILRRQQRRCGGRTTSSRPHWPENLCDAGWGTEAICHPLRAARPHVRGRRGREGVHRTGSGNSGRGTEPVGFR